MPQIIYLANHRFPTEKAYGIQIAKMCEAFSDAGASVTLLAPHRISHVSADPFSYYGVRKNFKYELVNSPDFYWPGKLDKIAFGIKAFISAWKLFRYANHHKDAVIFSRDELPLFFSSFTKSKLFFEAHKFSSKKKFFYSRFKKTGIKTIVITKLLKEKFISAGFRENNILTAPDGVDLKEFDIQMSKREARKKIDLPKDKKIILYTGQLFSWKGVQTLIDAKTFITDSLLVIVGGMPGEAKTLSFKYRDRGIMFIGFLPHSEIPYYLKAADVLVIPNKGDTDLARFYTSPLKLFEYMASKRPIVASDLPSIREVLDEESAVFFESGNPKNLAQSIEKVLTNQSLAESISVKAFEKVKNYTWEKRAQKISAFINGLNG